MIELLMTGLKGLGKNISDAEKNLKDGKFVEKTANEALRYARQYSPKKTGTLHDSIYIEVDKKGFYLGALAPYAIFNEYGSIYTPAGSVQAPLDAGGGGQRPFLRPAVYRAMNEIDVEKDIFGGKTIRKSAQGMRKTW